MIAVILQAVADSFRVLPVYPPKLLPLWTVVLPAMVVAVVAFIIGVNRRAKDPLYWALGGVTFTFLAWILLRWCISAGVFG